jgi:DNA-binding CsgD family transcriptional regulator
MNSTRPIAFPAGKILRIHADASVQSRVARLTQRQKDCLRLVAEGYTSKEVGRRLGISYSTVDNHLLAAVQILETTGRAEAARLLLNLERSLGQELPRQPEGLAESSHQPDDRSRAVEAQKKKWSALLPPIGGRENDLSPSQRVFAIARIALFSTLVFVACVIVIQMCFRALR